MHLSLSLGRIRVHRYQRLMFSIFFDGYSFSSATTHDHATFVLVALPVRILRTSRLTTYVLIEWIP